LLPRERAPDEMGNLTTLAVQELNRPGVFDFAREEFGADECVRAPAAALDQVNAELLGRFLLVEGQVRGADGDALPLSLLGRRGTAERREDEESYSRNGFPGPSFPIHRTLPVMAKARNCSAASYTYDHHGPVGLAVEGAFDWRRISVIGRWQRSLSSCVGSRPVGHRGKARAAGVPRRR